MSLTQEEDEEMSESLGQAIKILQGIQDALMDDLYPTLSPEQKLVVGACSRQIGTAVGEIDRWRL